MDKPRVSDEEIVGLLDSHHSHRHKSRARNCAWCRALLDLRDRNAELKRCSDHAATLGLENKRLAKRLLETVDIYVDQSYKHNALRDVVNRFYESHVSMLANCQCSICKYFKDDADTHPDKMSGSHSFDLPICADIPTKSSDNRDVGQVEQGSRLCPACIGGSLFTYVTCPVCKGTGKENGGGVA